jgi:hypothetical protein
VIHECKCPVAGFCATFSRTMSVHDHARCAGKLKEPPAHRAYFVGYWLGQALFEREKDRAELHACHAIRQATTDALVEALVTGRPDEELALQHFRRGLCVGLDVAQRKIFPDK